MNTASILEGINYISAGINPDTMTITLSALHGLQNLKERMEDAIRTETSVATGTKAALSAFKHVLADAKKEGREQLAYPWIDNDGMQVVCDGYRAYRYKDHLPLVERPGGLRHPEVSEKVIKDASTNKGQSLVLPSRNEVKAHITIKNAQRMTRKKEGVMWEFGEGLPAVNAEYLLDTLMAFPDAQAYVYESKPTLGPLFFESSHGDAILLPVRKNG